MEKKSKKSNKNDSTDEVIVVNLDGDEFLKLSPERITNILETLVKRVQIGNYCNDHPNLPVDEAIARFEKLTASQRRNFGIRPNDSLELFIRVMNAVCGKEHFPPIGKNGLRCHFTIQDFITGKV